MIIELRGVEFHNKGAELMLMAILEKVRKEFSEAQFVMETRPSVSINQKRKVGILTKFRYVKRGYDLSFIGHFISKENRLKRGIILESEIDIVLDGSGFAFGDIWGAEKARDRISGHIKKWKNQKKKVILLPQAFGPFENPSLREEMKIVTQNADLLFARDKYSFDFIQGLDNSKKSNVFLKPDFTNLLSGILPDYFKKGEKDIAIIPNFKMIETKIFENEEEYIDVLVLLSEKLRDRGFNPFFLNHEGKRDMDLIKKVLEKLSIEVNVIDELNPVYIKGIIGACHGVITSRFHGLVSALSQAVPCLCMGWSHKYDALLDEYKFKQGLILDENINPEGLESKLDLITLPSKHIEAVNTLKAASALQKESSEDMWAKVFAVIRQ